MICGVEERTGSIEGDHEGVSAEWLTHRLTGRIVRIRVS